MNLGEQFKVRNENFRKEETKGIFCELFGEKHGYDYYVRVESG